MKLRWMSVLLAVPLAGGLSLFAVSASSGAVTTAVAGVHVKSPDAVPPIPGGAVALGSVAGATVLHLDVALKVRNPVALAAFIRQVSDRSSPQFGHFLRRGQFGPRFGATMAEVAAVDAALRAEGMSPGPVTANRLAIPVTTSAATAERAFGIVLTKYRLPGGRIAYSNSRAPHLQAAAARFIQGVLGLSDVYRLQSTAIRPAPRLARHLSRRQLRDSRLRARKLLASHGFTPAVAGPRPCSSASSAALLNGSFTADQLAAFYAIPPLYQLGDLGKGIRVGLVEFEPNAVSDISAYATCYGIHTAVSYIKVDGGAGSGAGSGEAALDIEDVMGLAPSVAIDVYQAPNGGSVNAFDLYSKIISSDTDPVVSTSWGLCELDSDPTLLSEEHTLFGQAAAQGQTVFASAGDSGSTSCLGDGAGHDASLSALDPSSQPNVIGVGGTTLGTTAETVWNESALTAGAGGGGLSSTWCMPSYQHQTAIPGLISGDSAKKTGCPTAIPWVRQAPDVAADADPLTGYTILYQGGWGAIGGTSAAAPLWAALAALNDASPFCKYYGSGNAGVRPPGLYALAANDRKYIYTNGEGLYDVTQGNNDYTPSGYSGGLYPATTGYDMTSGLGTPLAVGIASGKLSTFYPGITALMCWQYGTKLGTTKITRISPGAGPASKRQTITITGTGFLPVAGADMASFGTRMIAARCSSTTRCTVTLPAGLKLGTITIRMSAEDFTLSPATAASRYRIVAAPVVSSLSPGRGRPRGGNTVTIRGRNFIGVTAVRFGSRKAGHVHVISATEITVTAPAGTGTVTVTVTAAGGTSATGAGSHYRY